MTQADFARQQQEARAFFAALAKLMPGAFRPDGKPLVAELRLLPLEPKP